MKLKKKHLETLFKVLSETKPSLAEARVRDRFIKDLKPEIVIFYDEKKAIIEKFCEKDGEDKPVLEGDKYTFKPEIANEVVKELDVLLSEEVEFKTKGAKKIKELIESTEYKPALGETELIDEVIALIK